MTFLNKVSLLIMMITLLSTMSLTGCGKSNNTPVTSTDTPHTTIEPSITPTPDDIVITIGNLTDLTGPTANGVGPVNSSLKDTVKYFNDENLIPGVELKVIEYDGQFDPSKDIPGYKWLRGKGADLIFAALPGATITLETTVNKDNVLLFATTGDLEAITPPGYVFTLGTIPQYEGYTLLKWLAENDPDFPQDRPAQIGGAAWADGYTQYVFDAMKEYIEVHPDQYEWVNGYITTVKFLWQTEIQVLKDCDYIFAPNPITKFADELRDAGSNAKLIGTDTHAAFLGLVDNGDYWDEIDGTLLLRSSLWWNEKEGYMINLTKDILQRYSASSTDEMMMTVGYLGVGSVYQIMDIIRRAAEAVGPENIDSQALYEATQSTSLVFDGVGRHSFTETKRDSVDCYVMYEIDAEAKDMFRADTEWIPVVREP